MVHVDAHVMSDACLNVVRQGVVDEAFVYCCRGRSAQCGHESFEDKGVLHIGQDGFAKVVEDIRSRDLVGLVCGWHQAFGWQPPQGRAEHSMRVLCLYL